MSGIKKLTVIGAGLMGSGIVQVAAQNNIQVAMCDMNQQALDKGTGYITSSLKRIAKKQFPEAEGQQKEYVDNILSKIQTSTDPLSAIKGSDLVIEAIVENLKIKVKIIGTGKVKKQSIPAGKAFDKNTTIILELS
jgi:3-hydroxyacyl-CoA dehydrogenase